MNKVEASHAMNARRSEAAPTAAHDEARTRTGREAPASVTARTARSLVRAPKFGLAALLVVVTGLGVASAACGSDDDDGTASSSDTAGATIYSPGSAAPQPALPPGAGPPTTQPNPDPDPDPTPDAGADTGTGGGMDAATDANTDAG